MIKALKNTKGVNQESERLAMKDAILQSVVSLLSD